MIGALKRKIEFLHKDEQGTSLTEFAIILPIFVMILLFIYHMGTIGNAITAERTEAQRDLWQEVATLQTQSHTGVDSGDSFQTYVTPQRGAQHSREHLADYPAKRQIDGRLSEEVTSHQNRVYQSMGAQGHWGESHARVQPAEGRMRLFGDERRAAANSSAVIGESRYAQGLVVDSGGNEIDYEVNRGMPAVIVAGLRYGSVHAIRQREVEFHHDEFNMRINVSYDVLVPPNPPFNGEQWAIDVSGQHLRTFRAYDDLAGIAQNQPLREESAPQVPTEWSLQEGD